MAKSFAICGFLFCFASLPSGASLWGFLHHFKLALMPLKLPPILKLPSTWADNLCLVFFDVGVLGVEARTIKNMVHHQILLLMTNNEYY